MEHPKLAVENYQQGQHKDLWQVFYSTIHQVCSAHYTEAQIQAWAPLDLDAKVWQNKIETIKPVVVKIKDKIAGYADLQEDGLIDHFFVHASFQRLGVGRALMTHILDLGANKPRLYSNVSITARPFFQHYGFAVTREQHLEVRDVTLTNFLMERRADLNTTEVADQGLPG